MKYKFPDIEEVAKIMCPRCGASKPNVSLNNVDGDIGWKFTCRKCRFIWLGKTDDKKSLCQKFISLFK